MIAVAIVAILAAIAIPSYSSFVRTTHLSEGTDALTEVQVKMEASYQNLGNYGTITCTGVTTTETLKYFSLSCSLTDGVSNAACTTSCQGYTYTATGLGSVSGTNYTIDQSGNKTTTGGKTCWVISGSEC